MKGPSFVCVGAQRSGTSWLFQCFKEHPQVYIPGKELHFFDQHYDKGIEWYKALFKQRSNDGIISGEMTPDYLFHNTALTRMAEDFPDLKIIVILREPFDRAYSAVGLLKQHGYDPKLPFDVILQKERYIIEQSLYFNQLTYLFSLYPMHQIRIYRFEEISENPLGLLMDAFDFVGVDNNFIPTSYDMKHNVSGLPPLLRFLNLTSIQNYLNSNKIGKQLLKVKKYTIFKMLKEKMTSKNSDVKSKYYTAELRSLFEEDIKKTEALTGLDLSNWYL